MLVRRVLLAARSVTHRFFHEVADLLFPPVCAFCEIDLPAAVNGSDDSDRRLCKTCREAIALPPIYRCPKCAARVAETFRDGDCPWCREHDLRFDRTFTLGSYEEPLREAALRGKRVNSDVLITALADLLWERIGDDLKKAAIDVVAPVPMYWWRGTRRGHNGPEVAAARFAHHLKKSYDQRLLTRTRSTQPQAGLSPPARRENVHNAFTVRRGRRVAGKHVLLVDDLLTSGATCSEAARILKQAKAAAVTVAVFARAQGET